MNNDDNNNKEIDWLKIAAIVIVVIGVVAVAVSVPNMYREVADDFRSIADGVTERLQ